MKKIQVWYHDDADGFGAAFAIWKAYKEYYDRFALEFTAVNYGQPTPQIGEGCDTLLIVDFSYSLEIMKELRSKVGTILVIDHHKTAQKELQDFLPSIFNMDKSGCVLTWEYFFGTTPPVPDILSYVQDRDLWKFELYNSEAINAYIYTLPFDFEVWNKFDTSVAMESGKAILSYRDSIIDRTVNNATLIGVYGLKVPIVNASCLQSEIGNKMCEVYKAPFSISYVDRIREGIRTYSLRSSGEYDVSVLAKQFGGGGHKGAAGFSVKLTDDSNYDVFGIGGCNE